MKRDLNLVREILLWATTQDGGFVSGNPSLPDYTDDQIAYHVHLMWQAGLVDAADNTHMQSPGPSAILLSVTWDGHDFLAAAKDDSLWERAKSKVLSSGGSITFDLLKELLSSLAKRQLGL